MNNNTWYAVGAAVSLAPGMVKQFKVAGRELAVYRTKADDTNESRLVAFSNRCPHRGTSMSLGKVTGKCLRCPMHGWLFQSDGQCVSVPSEQDDRAFGKRFHIPHYPAMESYGLIWIFVGSDLELLRRGVPAISELTQPGWRARYWPSIWQANQTRAIEILLDFSHVAYVHPMFGQPSEPLIPEYKIERNVEEWLPSWRAAVPFRPPRNLLQRLLRSDVSVSGQLTHYFPNFTRLDVSLGSQGNAHRLIIFEAYTPLSQEETKIHRIVLRNFFPMSAFDFITRLIVKEVIEQDRRLVVTQKPTVAPFQDPTQEKHARADALQLNYRKQMKRSFKDGTLLDLQGDSPLPYLRHQPSV